jgi:hypothetical protein
MIHEALEMFFVRERKEHPKNSHKIVRKKLKSILEENFPKVSNLKIRIEDILNFLVLYCKETFKKVTKALMLVLNNKKKTRGMTIKVIQNMLAILLGEGA